MCPTIKELTGAWATQGDQQIRLSLLSLDESDDEPIRSWTCAVSALDRVAPHLTGEALAVLRAPGMDPVALALSLGPQSAVGTAGGTAPGGAEHAPVAGPGVGRDGGAWR